MASWASWASWVSSVTEDRLLPPRSRCRQSSFQRLSPARGGSEPALCRRMQKDVHFGYDRVPAVVACITLYQTRSGNDTSVSKVQPCLSLPNAGQPGRAQRRLRPSRSALGRLFSKPGLVSETRLPAPSTILHRHRQTDRQTDRETETETET